MVGRFLDPVRSAHFLKFHVCQFFPGQRLHCRPKGRFHYAAGGAEDHACSGGLTQRIVKAFLREASKINAHLTDQPCQLPGGDGDIHIRHACRVLVVSAYLEFFCRTRHHADADNILRVKSHLFSIISLTHRSEHLLGRLTA